MKRFQAGTGILVLIATAITLGCDAGQEGDRNGAPQVAQKQRLAIKDLEIDTSPFIAQNSCDEIIHLKGDVDTADQRLAAWPEFPRLRRGGKPAGT